MADLTEIEQDVARERDAFRAGISALGDSLRPARLVESATAQLQGGELSETIAPALRNPKLPLALAGLGVSWFTAQMVSARATPRPVAAYDTSPTPTAGGFRRPDMTGPDMAEFDARIRAAEHATTGRFGTETYEGDADMTHIDDHANPTLRDRAYASADALRSRIEEGMENLPDAARDRIRKAREAAIDAQGQVEYHARRAASAARQTAQDNPLLIGALAFAAGAAIAAALPRTSMENRSIGAQRDRLFDEADRVFREEVEKAKTMARDTVAQGQDRVKETIGDVADTVSKSAEKMKSDSGKARSHSAAHN